MGWGFVGFILFSIFHVSSVTASEFVREIEHPLEKALVPVGYDNNDSVQIVVTGKFKSTCYQIGTIYTSVDRKRKIVELQLSAYEYKGCLLDVEVPFHQVVSIGLLREEGTYQLRDMTNKKEIGVLKVDPAPASSEGTDQFSYPPLLDAFVVERRSGRRVLMLTGVFSDSCLRFQDVEVKYYPEVVVVLPKIHRPRNSGCEKGEFAFKREVPLVNELPKKFLLHVRSWGGQSINKTIVTHSLKKQSDLQ